MFFRQKDNSNGNQRTAAKFIVFLSQLLLLFKTCFSCKTDNPQLYTRQLGTMVEVKTVCSNPSCSQENYWSSQPNFGNSNRPAGNTLLSMATLFAGASISKIITIFNHMGLACISHTTFFKLQRVSYNKR